MASVRVVVHGDVQGVGYRWHARDAAVANGVVGWVRNRRDGTVEAELHGSIAAVQAVLDALAHGPLGAQVDDVAVTEVSTSESRDFEIRATA